MPSASPALVLSYGYWKAAFGGQESVLGKIIRLNNIAFEIVGVSEPGFTNLAPGKTQDFFVPLSLIPELHLDWLAPKGIMSDPQTWWLVVLGRLKPGISFSQAQAAATSIFRNEVLHGAKPLSTAVDDPHISLVPATVGLTGVRGDLSALLYVLMAAVGFILLISCTNVAGLTLARSTARQKEIAVRLAIGAGRRRIVRQMLTESLLLSGAGGALGVLVAAWGVRAITLLLSSALDRPFPFVFSPDWRVLTFALGVTFLSGMLFGIAPALRGSRVDLTPALKVSATSLSAGASRTHRWFHLGNALVVAQMALSILVLVGAGLFVRTLRNLKDVNPGFDTRNLLLFGIDPTLAGYQDTQIQNLYRQLRQRFQALPGVLAVTYSSSAFLSGSLMSTEVHLDGAPPKSNVPSDVMKVGPDFLSTMRIPLLSGHAFTSSDFASAAATGAATRAAAVAARKTPGTPPARGSRAQARLPSFAPIPLIVNETFARKYFPKENPVGKHLGDYEAEGPQPGPHPGYLIVGIAADTKYNNLRRDIHPTMYVPAAGDAAHFELRASGDPTALLPAVRSVVGQTDSNLPLFNVRTQTQQIDDLLVQERQIAVISSFFGVLALALCCIGLYGLLAYEVSRRTREIGIRMALGALQGNVVRLVVGQGMALTGAGAVLGIVGAWGLTRFLSAILFGVRPDDSLTFLAVVFLLVLVCLAACYVPARRAMRVDPMVALRYE